MKDIMARESSDSQQGVASFEYSPASNRQPLLFEYSRPLDDLGDLLLRDFAGKQLKMVDIYRQNNVNTPFVERNYKDALKLLEDQGKITANPPKSKRIRNTFAGHVLVTFPN